MPVRTLEGHNRVQSLKAEIEAHEAVFLLLVDQHVCVNDQTIGDCSPNGNECTARCGVYA